MPTVLSPNKGYPLQQTGENSGTWGVVLDGGLSTLDLNMGGRLSKAVTAGTVTLTATEASNLIYTFTGTLTGACTVAFPAVGSFYIVKNATTGAFPLTVKTSAGGSTGPTIPQGATWAIFTDGTNGAPQQSGLAYGLDSGTTSAFIVTTDAGNTATYPGSVVIWTAASTNIAASTMAVDGGSAKAIYQPSAAGPIQAVAGYVVTGDTLVSIYNPALNTGTGGWFTIGGIPSFAAITVTDSLTITSTDAGAAAAPILELYRNSATPASADLLGQALWTGMNSAAVKTTYSLIEPRLDNPTSGTESATLLFETAQAGTVAARMALAAGLVVGAPTGSDKGAGTLNATGVYLNGNALGITPLDITGLLPTSIGGSNTTAAIGMSGGSATDSTGTATISRASGAWAVSNGNAINGYQGGATLPNSTTIHMFVVSGTGGSGFFASTSLASPTLPSGGFTLFRHVFSFITDSSGAPRAGTAIEREGGAYEFIYTSKVTSVPNNTAPSTTGTNYTMTAPTGFNCELNIQSIYVSQNNTAAYGLIQSPSTSSTVPSVTDFTFGNSNAAIQTIVSWTGRIIGDTTANIFGRFSNAGTGSSIGIQIISYVDFRRI